MENDMNALEEMYPQGEKVTTREFLYSLFFMVVTYSCLDIHYGAGRGYLGFYSACLHWETHIRHCWVSVNIYLNCTFIQSNVFAIGFV